MIRALDLDSDHVLALCWYARLLVALGRPVEAWPVPEEASAARAAALQGKEVHEFHLSTNYRNSAEIYAHAAAYMTTREK